MKIDERRFRDEKELWQKRVTSSGRMREVSFTTVSGQPVELLYTPEDLRSLDFHEDVGFPGEYPYTRGIHATMYRSKLWTMRQFAGFGTPEDTNARYHYLLNHGQTGLSVAFDLPTLMGGRSAAGPVHQL